jgi:hypothetical protein
MDVKNVMAAIAAGSMLISPVAYGQSVPATPDSQMTIPEKNATSSPEKLKQQAAPSTIQTGRSDSLSTKLNRSNGLIAPKTDVDPGMKMPAPSDTTGSTPVVPPSATGGENAK